MKKKNKKRGTPIRSVTERNTPTKEKIISAPIDIPSKPKKLRPWDVSHLW